MQVAFEYAGVIIQSYKLSSKKQVFRVCVHACSFQEVSVEAWRHRRIDQRQESQFNSRGEAVVCRLFRQSGVLAWCPAREPTKTVTSNHRLTGVFSIAGGAH